MPLRAAIYCRISSTDPDVPKVADQEARCRKLADAEGYVVAGSPYVDDGISAYQSLKDRPGWAELKAGVEAKAFDVLLFDRQDRLARDQFETLTFLAACGRAGIAWHSVDGGYADLADPMQVFMAVFRGGEAEGYSRKISENVSRRFAADRDKGLPRMGGIRPFGWQPDRMKLDPKESALVRAGIDSIMSGGARWDVVKMFNASGQRTTRGKKEWLPSTVYDTLKRGLNAALVEHKGELLGQGQWDPICTPDELQQVRDILAVPVRESSGKPPATLLSGLALCTCGSVMHAHGQNWARVYRCSTHDRQFGKIKTDEAHTAIKIDNLDRLVVGELITRYWVAPPVSTDSLDKESAEISRIHKRLGELNKEIDDLAFALRNGLPRATWVTQNASLVAEQQELRDARRALSQRSAHAAMMTKAQSFLSFEGEIENGPEDLVKAIEALETQWRDLSLDDKRAVIDANFIIVVNRSTPVAGGTKRVVVTPKQASLTDTVGLKMLGGFELSADWSTGQVEPRW